MKQLNFNGEAYEAERIIKTSNSIVGYIEGQEVFNFKYISDFHAFQLEEGQGWDISEEDEKALYQLDIDFRLSLLETGVNVNDL